MMIEATAAAVLTPDLEAMIDEEPASSMWVTVAEDARFFLLCYLAGLVVFLVMLS